MKVITLIFVSLLFTIYYTNRNESVDVIGHRGGW
jgi:hypothetical protein